jgi:uncharacterized protein
LSSNASNPDCVGVDVDVIDAERGAKLRGVGPAATGTSPGIPGQRSSPAVKAALEAEDISAWFRRMPWHKGGFADQRCAEYEDYLFEQWSHGTFDDYWRQPGLYPEGFYDRYTDVPIVHLSGWYDPYARTAMENYVGLSSAKRSWMQLILSPWTHGDRSLSYAGEVDFGPAAPVDGNLAADFFDLRRRWPLPQTRWTRLYLHPDRRLLAAPATAASAALDYTFDPRDPVPSLGGAISSGEPIMYAGAFDQSAAANRADVLVFEPPLDHHIEVAGPTTARLWMASDTPDTDFTEKLIDVYPPSADFPHGFALSLTEGLLRMRYRDSWEAPALIVPGEVYAITIKMFPTANLFCRGHRLRLEISSSNFPHFDVNPNSGEPEGSWQRPRIARNRVFVEANRPSHILLPVIRPGGE